MKIAELFVNLGVKGADTSKRALTGVKDGLSDIASVGIETKAIILAVVYGLEQMMSQSAQMGTGLTNFNALTGISAENLQRWQGAARQAGVGAEEMTGSIKSVQNAMTNMLMGKGAPEGMAMVANKVGLDPARARDTLYVMGQLQKFAQSVPQDVGNQMLKSFGLSEGTIAAMRRNVFRPDILNKIPIYGDRERSSLDKANVAWLNLGNKVQMAFGHFTAAHGTQLVSDISKITTEVFKLIDALTKLADRLKVFELIGKAAKVATISTQLATQAVSEATGESKNTAKGTAVGDVIEWRNQIDQKIFEFFKSIPLPKLAPQTPAPSGSPVSFNQQVHIHGDGHDAKSIGTTTAQETKRAARQLSSQSRNN